MKTPGSTEQTQVKHPAVQKKNTDTGTTTRHLTALPVLACIVVAILLMAGCTSVNPPQKSDTSGIAVTDSPGTSINPGSPATRIVSLNSDATEMLIALGAGNSIVGVTDTTLKNPQISPFIPNAQSVGTWDAPNLELILGLKPDVIISYSGYRLKNADQFERAKIPVVYIDCNRIPTLRSDAVKLGAITGHSAEAEKYVAFVDKWTAFTQAKTAGAPLVPAYIEGYSDYMAQATNSSINDLVLLARGENIAGSEDKSYIRVTPEWVIRENPSVIMKVAPDPLPEGTTLDRYRAQVADRPALAEVDAVRNGDVYALGGKVVLGPRAPAGLPIVAAVLHPDQFATVNPYEALDEYSRDFLPGSNSTAAVSPLPGKG